MMKEAPDHFEYGICRDDDNSLVRSNMSLPEAEKWLEEWKTMATAQNITCCIVRREVGKWEAL